jgi:hypothetical protein
LRNCDDPRPVRNKLTLVRDSYRAANPACPATIPGKTGAASATLLAGLAGRRNIDTGPGSPGLAGSGP